MATKIKNIIEIGEADFLVSIERDDANDRQVVGKEGADWLIEAIHIQNNDSRDYLLTLSVSGGRTFDAKIPAGYDQRIALKVGPQDKRFRTETDTIQFSVNPV